MKRVTYCIPVSQWQADRYWRFGSGIENAKYREYDKEVEFELLVEDHVATMVKIHHPNAIVRDSSEYYGIREEDRPKRLKPRIIMTNE